MSWPDVIVAVVAFGFFAFLVWAESRNPK